MNQICNILFLYPKKIIIFVLWAYTKKFSEILTKQKNL